MTERTFESQFAELAARHLDALESGDWVARMNYESRIGALKREQLDIANARIAELEAALKWVIMDAKKSNDLPLLYRAQAALKGNPTTEETPCSPL
jgi:BMFP domain-containing protein YqiC